MKRLLPLLLLLAGCAGAPEPPPATVRQPAESPALGLQALNDGRIDEAGKRFSRILLDDPDNRDARLGMAEVHLAQGRPRDALPLFEGLEGDRLLRPLALQGKGLALLALGRRPQAGQALAEAADSSSVLWRAWDGLGRLADAEKRWPDADAAYGRALAIQPRAAAVQANLGYSLLLRGQGAQAERPLRAALALEPGLKGAQSALRLCLAWQGRYREALAGVPAAQLPQLLNDVGYVAYRRGDLQAAETYLQQAMNLSPRYLPQADANLSAIRAARR